MLIKEMCGGLEGMSEFAVTGMSEWSEVADRVSGLPASSMVGGQGGSEGGAFSGGSFCSEWNDILLFT